jgi:phage tail-like protein
VSIAAQSTDRLVVSLDGEDADGLLLRYDLDTSDIEFRSMIEGSWDGMVSGTVGTTGDDRAVYLRSADNGAVWKFVEGRENKKNPENTRYEGTLVGRFDAGMRDTHWHRMTPEVDQVDPGNRIDIQYYASDGDTEGVDDFDAIDAIDADRAAALEANGIEGLWDLIEVDAETIAAIVEDVAETETRAWLERARHVLESEFETRTDAHEVTDPTDVLLSDARGRYLHVQVRLVGSQDSSPRLHAVNARCPRKSYLRYLPEMYQRMGQSSQFLSRFLSLFETTFVDIEDNAADLTDHMDPHEIPNDYLSWLNGWLAVDLGKHWPEEGRRELLAQAPELYKQRGTRDGLLNFIELYLDHVDVPETDWERPLNRLRRQLAELEAEGFLTADERDRRVAAIEARRDDSAATDVFVIEHESLSCIETPELRQRYERLYGYPRRFQVLLGPAMPSERVDTIESIVDSEKPVFADVAAQRLSRRFQTGERTYLGINTYLPKRKFEIEGSTLGTQTILEQDVAASADGRY